jgi:hypothetical protein
VHTAVFQPITPITLIIFSLCQKVDRTRQAIFALVARLAI